MSHSSSTSSEASGADERLRALLEAAVDGIVTFDESGEIETVNASIVRLFGYEPSELIGQDVRMLMPGCHPSEYEDDLRRHLETGERRMIRAGREVEGRKKDGTTFPLDVSLSEAHVGGRRLVTGILRDATERKQMEEALRVSEERFAKAFRGSPDALLMIKNDGTILEVNDGFENVFGYARAAATGRTIDELDLFARPEDRRHWRELFSEQGRLAEIEVDLRTKDGDVRHVRIAFERITVFDEPCILADVRDETERRNAERALLKSERRYRAIFELSAVGQAELELPMRRFLAVNRRFCEITGYSESELLKMTVVDVTHPDDRSYDTGRFDRTLADGRREHVSEKRYLRKDGTVRWVDVRGRLMTNEDGEPTRIVEIISDVTDRRAAEQALRENERKLREVNETLEQRVSKRTDELVRANETLAQRTEEIVLTNQMLAQRTEALVRVNQTLAQRNRELRDFANVASHDLREPLRKIQTFADLVESDYGASLDADGRLYLERIRAVASRMTHLLNDLRSFSRITSGANPFIRVELNEVVEDVLSDLEIRIQDSGARIEVESLPAVKGIPSHLRQLFQNIIENALKFHQGDDVPNVRVVPAPGGETGMVRVVVEDDGIGFDAAHAERIFVPFQRLHGPAKYEGTGMGLAICRRIVEHHGGTVTAESDVSEGARFIITLQSADGMDVIPPRAARASR